MSIGDIISAGANLIGGFFNREQQEDFNENQKYQALRNESLQREFATQGIRWKVDDAKAAGIHPLYALGANTTSFSPVTVGGQADTSLGNAMANAGQNLGRAIDATRTSDERSQAVLDTAQRLSLEKSGLENDLLRVQLAQMRAQLGPPMPSLTDTNAIPGQPATKLKEKGAGLQGTTSDPRMHNLPGDIQLSTPGNESTQDAISKEYGDEGFPQLPGQYRFIRDFIQKFNRMHRNWNNEQRARYDRTHSRSFYSR